jgi:glycosyltransferase involved in cell wall biosynthesis
MAARRRKIAVLNLNSTHRDPRVLRMGSALAALGHEVVVFEMLLEGMAERETIRGMDVRRIPVPNSYRDADMAEIGQADPEAARIIEQSHAWVYRFPQSSEPSGGRLGRFVRRVGRRILPAREEAPATPSRSEPHILPIRHIMLVNLAIFRAAREFAPEIVHCNDLNTLLTGFMLKRALGTALVYDAHEIYPEQFAEDQRSEIWHTFYTRLEQQLVRHADAKLTVCESLAEYFARVYDANGFVTVRNLPSIAHLAPDSILERKRERPVILYHGSYVPYRGLEEIIEASRYVEGATFRFRGIGDHVKNLEQLADARGLGDRVEFVPPVAVDDLVPTASECDIGVAPFVPVCKNTEYALPNKFFEYLMAGLACASSDLVELRRLTDRYRVGLLFGSQDPRAIADGLNELVARPLLLAECRANALQAARTELNWETEARRFHAFYEPILGG